MLILKKLTPKLNMAHLQNHTKSSSLPPFSNSMNSTSISFPQKRIKEKFYKHLSFIWQTHNKEWQPDDLLTEIPSRLEAAMVTKNSKGRCTYSHPLWLDW